MMGIAHSPYLFSLIQKFERAAVKAWANRAAVLEAAEEDAEPEAKGDGEPR